MSERRPSPKRGGKAESDRVNRIFEPFRAIREALKPPPALRRAIDESLKPQRALQAFLADSTRRFSESAEAARSRMRRRIYIERKSPLYVWEEIDSCVTRGVPLPEWAREYLGRAADSILKQTKTQGLVKSLEFSRGRGGRSFFSSYRDEERRWQISLEFHDLLEQGVTAEAAADSLAAHHRIDPRTVHRYFYDEGYGRLLDCPLDEL